jgi:tryptophan-rich sensory protein
MINSIEEYLSELRKELSGSDRATIQDALSDAEEYLRTAMSNVPSDRMQSETLALVIEKYGTPAEVAAAYKQIESRTLPTLAVEDKTEPGPSEITPQPVVKDNRPFLVRFFRVFAEPRAWGALLYLMLAMVTGIFYFTWVVTGLSVSSGLIILIVGLPIAGLFLLSVRGIALVEGRLVEALLGVRMPRRPRYSVKNISIWQRFKNMLVDKHTWFSMIYMLLQMPLGIVYFTAFITLISVSLWLIFWPIASIAIGWPVFVTPNQDYYATGWLVPLTIVAGGLLLTVTMHLAKVIGKGHGTLAKALLVRL